MLIRCERCNKFSYKDIVKTVHCVASTLALVSVLMLLTYTCYVSVVRMTTAGVLWSTFVSRLPVLLSTGMLVLVHIST